VLWAKRFFADLTSVEGDIGARKMIGAYAEAVTEVPVDDDAVTLDIDTPTALAALRAS
jgi:molybdenum cofactor cytidylyltransferase